MGKAIDGYTYVPTSGNEDLAFGFEVHPLGDGVDVVEVNPRRSPSPQVPLITSPVRVPALTTTFDVANPLSKQSQASLFTGLPVVPVVPPPVPVVYVEPEPEPEPVVIGHTGNNLPDPAPTQRKFVIGAAANGDEVTKPLARNRATVGAAGVAARPARPASTSRSQTVIGAARSRSSRPSTTTTSRQSTPTSNSRRGSGIVIGLRHNNVRKRRSFPFVY